VTQAFWTRAFSSLVSENAGGTGRARGPIDTRPYDKVPVAIPADHRFAGRPVGVPLRTDKPYEDSSPWHHAACMSFSSDQAPHVGDAVVTAPTRESDLLLGPAARRPARRLDPETCYGRSTQDGCYMNIPHDALGSRRAHVVAAARHPCGAAARATVQLPGGRVVMVTSTATARPRSRRA